MDKKLEMVQKESLMLEKQIHTKEIRHRNELGRYNATVQCEECKKASRNAVRRSGLVREKEFEYFHRVTEDDWNGDIFLRINTQGPIWRLQPEQKYCYLAARILLISN